MTYKGIEVVKIIDSKQAMLYMKHNLECLKCFTDKKTDKIIYLFPKKESQPLYTLWLNRELK